jgi:hypothetical protein
MAGSAVFKAAAAGFEATGGGVTVRDVVGVAGPVVLVATAGFVVLDATPGAVVAIDAARGVAGGCGSDLVAFFSSVAAVTTGVPTAATGSLLPVAATSSPGMLPSHAIRLARANPRTNEITREVVSIA